jgi:hypothetical protein
LPYVTKRLSHSPTGGSPPTCRRVMSVSSDVSQPSVFRRTIRIIIYLWHARPWLWCCWSPIIVLRCAGSFAEPKLNKTKARRVFFFAVSLDANPSAITILYYFLARPSLVALLCLRIIYYTGTSSYFVRTINIVYYYALLDEAGDVSKKEGQW